MAQVGPLGGTAFFKINGTQYQLKGNLKIRVGGLVAAGVVGQDAVHGYTEKPEIPMMSLDISDSGGLSLQQIQAVRNATCTAELNNGKVYVGQGGFCTSAIEVDTAQAQLQAEFQFLSMIEQMP